MKMFRGVMLWCAMAGSAVAMAQAKPMSAGAAISGTRYFQLTLVLRYTASQGGLPVPGEQSITTEVAVIPDRPGASSSRTRMGSQIPVVIGGKTQLIDVGTSFDCNNVRVEGDGVAMSIVLETSRLGGMVPVKEAGGVEVEEPLITQRKIELSIKLPLDTPKVVFDSKMGVPGHPLKPVQSLGPGDGKVPAQMMLQEPGMQVEMTAKELK
jgi:hypothetical protein